MSITRFAAVVVSLGLLGSCTVKPAGLTDGEIDHYSPVIVRAEDSLSLAWAERMRSYGSMSESMPMEVCFSKLSPNGDELTGKKTIGEGGIPDIVWTGSSYGLVCINGGSVLRFAKLDADGNIVGEIIDLDDRVYQTARILWDGGEFVLVYKILGESIYAERFSGGERNPSGAIELHGPEGSSSYEMDAAWAGSRGIVTWRDLRDGVPQIYATLISLADDGTLRMDLSELRVSDGSSSCGDPAADSSGSEFAIAWIESAENASGSIRTARLGADGTLNGEPAAFPSPEGGPLDPRIAFGEGKLGLVWSSDKGTGHNVFFTALDLNGAGAGEEVNVTEADTIHIASSPDIAWTGSRFGVVWTKKDESTVMDNGGHSGRSESCLQLYLDFQ